MAAVLVVLYIPCDSQDTDSDPEQEQNSQVTKPTDINGQNEQESEADPDKTDNSPTKTGSGGTEDEDATIKLPSSIENGKILLIKTDGIPEHEHLPLLEHAAESPVVGIPVVLRASTGAAGEQAGKPTPRRRVGFAGGEPGETPQAEAEPAMGDGAGNTHSMHVDSWSLEDALQELLDRLPVDNDVWTKADDDTVLQVSFLVSVEEVDGILRALTTFGIGSIPDTSITTFAASFHQAPRPKVQERIEVEADGTLKRSPNDENRSDFLRTIKSRLTVAQVVAAVEGNARATFDFIMLICLASFIAALGLVENSSVILVASMLISPLMGPILGGVFGFVIQNEKLTWLGVQNAFIGLVLCLVVGFLFGLVVSGVNSHGTLWGSSDIWPTTEMASRGMVRSLWVGVLIALPSGAGVALSVLGGNVGSLVGVAISASLLPPAVNAGMLWAYSIMTAIVPPETVLPEVTTVLSSATTVSANDSLINATTAQPPWLCPASSTTCLKPPNCPALRDNAYHFVYSCSMAREAALLGVVSLVLTLLNILCIFIMGVIVLKIKEVAPHTTVSPVTEVFWKKDLPLARDCYKTLKGKDSLDTAKMAKDIAKEWKENNKDLDEKELRKSWYYLVKDLHHCDTIHDMAELQPINNAPRRHTVAIFTDVDMSYLDDINTSQKASPTARTPHLLRTLSDQGQSVEAGGPAAPPANFYTASPYSRSGDGGHALRHRNPFFRYSQDFTPSPDFTTPPTSDDSRFNHRSVRAQKPRVPRWLQKQRSLDTEIEKAVMKNLPEKFGRFMVRTINEEQEPSPKSPPGGAPSDAAPPFLLKKPEKKSVSSLTRHPDPDSVLIHVEPETMPTSSKQLRDQFFST